ncbi:LysM peptidoglycan-binding domain-containing protein [Microbacterium protaetiae]|uniref:LysM peptidoglycan-binding domain-containing protein n=1 Tax=Microbacterium protaetiae TaxID=2509458 RepID=A0A4P6ENQ1_9MICO|nr:LysM peptidoglycan-binding domain-containing protein [Microbacterium protaetiae]
MPAAIAGSLALSLAGAPAAHAADTGAERSRQPQAPATPHLVPQAVGVTIVSGFDAALAATLAPAADIVAAAKKNPTTHKIVRGDTISAIAARYGLRTADLLAWNGLGWSTVIYPGQTIRLTAPSGAAKTTTASEKAPTPATTTKVTSSASYTVRSGDTVGAIARAHGLSTQAVLNANKLRWSSIIYPGQKLVIPGKAAPAAASAKSSTAPSTKKSATTPATKTQSTSSGGTVLPGQTYTVTAGDTMSAIAAKHGVSVAALLKANGMDFSSIIYPGQKVTIPTSGIPGLTTEQAANARLIVRIGRALGVSNRGIAIALGTAMQESGLRNLDYGDRDSLGLFQQRPSTGWGTEAQVRDAERATRAFFGGPSDPNGTVTRGLLDIPGWEKMSFADAAQAVQISAYPTRYAQWEKPAYAWLAAIK